MPVPRRSSCRIFGEEVLRGCWGVDCSSTFLYYRSNNTTHLLHLVPFENTVFSESGGKAVFFERRGQPSNQTPSKQPYHAYRSCRLALGLATAVLDVHPQHNSRAARRRPQGTGSSFLIGCLLASCSRIPAHRTSDPGLPVSDKKSKKRASYKGLGFGARRPPKPTPRHAGIAVVLAAALVVWLSFHTAAKPADIQVCVSVSSRHRLLHTSHLLGPSGCVQSACCGPSTCMPCRCPYLWTAPCLMLQMSALSACAAE